MTQRFPYGCFSAKTVRSLEVSGFKLTETVYSPNLKLSTHVHDQHAFVFLLQGGFTENFGGKSRRFVQSNGLFRPAGEPHSNLFNDKGGSCLNVEINSALIERLREYGIVLNEFMEINSKKLASIILGKLYYEFREADEVSPIVIEGLLLETVAAAIRHRTQTAESSYSSCIPRWLGQARELLRTQFSLSLTLDIVAAAVGVHPVHLAREFRRHYHQSVGEYIRQLRVEFACQKLSTSDISLVEIALDAGFSHQSHFTRTFKQQTGMTPAKYRAIFQ